MSRTMVLALCVMAGSLAGRQAPAGEIHEAARRGDLAAVQRILQADPATVASRSADEAAETPLTTAAWEGHGEVVRVLLEHGADPSARNSWGRTPLHNAASRGHRDVAVQLLDAGAEVDAQSGSGATPLFDACMRFHPEVAHLLLDRGARIDTRTDYEQTPLHACLGVAGQDLGLIRRLIERGADVNAQANRGDTPLSWAIARGNLEVAGLLIERGARLDSYSHPDGSLVHKALQLGQPEMARLLVERGATVDRADPYGFRELHWAAIRGHADLIGLLVEHGAEVDRVDSRNRTPLHYAARHGHRGAAEALIGLGADRGGIEEEDYGLAPQLRRRLDEGEAFLWYLGGHAGDAWAVKTRDHLLLFDPDGFDPGPEAGLANGRLSPRELAGLDLRVFISKPPHDRFGLEILRPPAGVPTPSYVIGFEPPPDESKVDPRAVHHVVPGQELDLDGIRVRAIGATLGGLAYRVDVDGLRFYYGGYHAANEPGQREAFRTALEPLADDGVPVDIAFLNAAGHLIQANTYEEYPYLVRRLRAQTVYLKHGAYGREAYWECRARLAELGVLAVEHPRSEGDRFHFRRRVATE